MCAKMLFPKDYVGLDYFTKEGNNKDKIGIDIRKPRLSFQYLQLTLQTFY